MVVLAVIVGGGILSWIKMQEVSPIELLEIKKPEKVVEDEPPIGRLIGMRSMGLR